MDAPALQNPTHVVVGTTDTERTAAFLSRFGFASSPLPDLPPPAARTLYGLEGTAAQTRVVVPGTDRGFIRLVRTPHGPRAFATFDPRPFAIDLYTRDISRSVSIAQGAGAQTSPIVDHRFGPIVVREAEVHGPDGLLITLLALETRRSSVLDADPERLHSEVHSFVWSVEDTDGAVRFWEGEVGLRKVTDARFGGTTLARVLGLGERELSARFVVLTDRDDRPVRVQTIEFLGEEGQSHEDRPLAAGLDGVAFEVADLRAAMARLRSARFGQTVRVGERQAVSASAPGKLRFELWQRG